MIRAWLGPALVAVAACRPASPRSPEQLRAAWAEAVSRDDAERAWRLLAPEVQARTSKAAFTARFHGKPGEHPRALAEIAAVARTTSDARTATTVGTGGRLVSWVKVRGRWSIREGLPGIPNLETPQRAIHSLIAAIRTVELGELRRVLAPALAAALGRDLEARAEAIERALADPGALELDRSLSRATLRYGADRTLTLDRTPSGWRVVALE